MNRAYIPIVVSALMLAGCVKNAPPVASAPDSPVTALKDLPEPEATDVVRSTRLAFIGPFTELRVEVFGVPDMQRDIMTDGKGNFAFPLVGSVAAAGKTPGDVSEEIRQKLAARYIRDPQVTVNFKSTLNPLSIQSMSVTVDGQVNKAGAYPVVGRVTLMRAVALAGGTNEFAKLQDVVVFRDVGNQKYVGIYNLEGIRRGNYPDPEIFPNDVVIVGDSPARRRFKDILAVVPAFLSPIILLAREF
ncbi:MAG TPA: polysaccharide biosynthesis/export family protein [Sphingopyxis sp.]|uniref:polysaccharide biosynthesis/export family protein n=1 Tax=Sphingopyxis sp. TaxID=1908224 RepID=UPI002E33466F|nr:polysaccharide biosynthesis/export family protein [Sphingopyxis sp.]HEX2812372.1 polysaccharide biosynthesis/export family protein [Sphingopyxis sp.]